MYLLDTSVVSNFLDEKRYYPQLTAKILNQPPEQIFISVITVEEILQGALASVQKAKRKPSVSKAYQYFEELFLALNRFQILPYTSSSGKDLSVITCQNKKNRYSRLSYCCDRSY